MRPRRPRLAGLTAALAVVVLSACAPTLRPPGPTITEPALIGEGLTDLGMRTADGQVLPLRIWRPKEGSPKAVIIALHGFNDYSGFFDAPGKFLAGKGFLSYAYDQRGFGEAPGRGYWPGSDALAADLAAMTGLIRERHPGLPLYLLGESMGGAVVMTLMIRPGAPRVNGVILAAPAVWGRTAMPFYQRWTLALAAYTVPFMTVTGRGLEIHPSDNIEMLRKLSRDPLVIKETRIDAIHGLTNLMDRALAAAAAFRTPALILYGKKDEVVPGEATRIMVRALPRLNSQGGTNAGGRKAGGPGAGEQRLAYYENGFHMLLRDLQAETVLGDIAAWIAAPAAPLPSGADRETGELLVEE